MKINKLKKAAILATVLGGVAFGSNAEAAKIAADYAVECMKATAEEENHWYGSKFEPVLYKLINMLK